MSVKTQFIRSLLDRLWDDYAKRVPYARIYQNMLAELGGTFVNDHIAYRSLAVTVNGHYLGIPMTKRIFDAMGFEEKGAIDFPEQKLFARYVQHAEPDFPRIFISELKVDELPAEVAALIRQSVADFRMVLSDADVETVANLDRSGSIPEGLVERVARFFLEVPWSPPTEEAVRKVNEASQYGAWVLLHGYSVNHFTGYVNRHGVEAVDDIEKLVEELKRRGVPMKSEIEGERGSKLRQTSTEAVRVPVKVKDASGAIKEIEWTYAYMEYAERGYVEENGKQVLFEGFLGPQAKQLFEMTRLK